MGQTEQQVSTIFIKAKLLYHIQSQSVYVDDTSMWMMTKLRMLATNSQSQILGLTFTTAFNLLFLTSSLVC